MRSDLATVARAGSLAVRPWLALTRAGWRRHLTYRQATIASIFTNSIFGFLKCYVLLAAAAGAAGGIAAGYDAPRLATYCWASQGLFGVVGLLGWTELGDRIRTGDVVSDLLRPVDPVTSYLFIDLGRAGHAALTRLVVPVLVGLICFDLYLPGQGWTYPLFLVSAVLAVLVCFCGRYLMNAVAFWLLDVRGVNVVWSLAITVLTGLAFPIHFLPDWATVALWVATPFPSMLQAPLDVLVERGTASSRAMMVAGQAAWVVVLMLVCRLVQSRAGRRLVIQGG